MKWTDEPYPFGPFDILLIEKDHKVLTEMQQREQLQTRWPALDAQINGLTTRIEDVNKQVYDLYTRLQNTQIGISNHAETEAVENKNRFMALVVGGTVIALLLLGYTEYRLRILARNV